MVDINQFELEYRYLLQKAIAFGSKEKTRTGVDCYTLHGQEIKFDLSKGKMPLVTGKKVYVDKAIVEFDWIKSGSTTTDYLVDNGVNWWNQYADPFGYLGKTYGYQLRSFNGYFDQLAYVKKEIKNRSRRAHITFWNPTELEDTALPCCYTGMTFVVIGDKLHCDMQFRSSDLFLGLPYDFLIGALFLRYLSFCVNLNMGSIKYSFANAHVYDNHTDQVTKYLGQKQFPTPYYQAMIRGDFEHGPIIKAKLNN